MSLAVIQALAPGMLWFLPVAALPVVFHLFLRLRRQTRVFPSLQFFLAADPHLHARRRVREWLVLALRCAALLFLVLALARPQWRGVGTVGDVAAVWIVDNSASMSAVDRDGRSRLQRALAVARALADDPGVRRAAVVPTVPDPAIVIPGGFTEDRAVWRTALAAIRPTQASGSPGAAMARATAILAGSLVGAAELHVFTDAQANEWGIPVTGNLVPAHVRLLVHRVGDARDRAGDVAIAELAVSKRRPVAGRPFRVEALLRSVATAERSVVLNQAVGGSAEPVRHAARVPAGGTARVPLTARFGGDTEAQGTLRVWLEGDAASAAADAWLATSVTSGESVWLAGRAEGFGLLAEALSPGGDASLSGLRTEAVDAARLRSASKQNPAMVAVAGDALADSAAAEGLRRYVEAGGTLLVAPATDGGGLALPGWCGIRAGAEERSAAGTAVTAVDSDAVVWEDLRDAAGRLRLPPLRATRWFPLETDPAATPLFRNASGQTLGAERGVGAGRVVVSGVAWSTAWSDLPRRGAFLAWVQSVALAGRGGTEVLRAGDVAAWARLLAANGTNGTALVVALAGDAWRAEGRVGTLPPPARAGVYRVAYDATTRVVSVAGDPAEADPRLVPDGALPYPAVAADQVRVALNAVGTVAAVRRGRHGVGLFGAFVALAVLCGLAEGWFAQRAATGVPGRGTHGR